jgi:hypothetical protein
VTASRTLAAAVAGANIIAFRCADRDVLVNFEPLRSADAGTGNRRRDVVGARQRSNTKIVPRAYVLPVADHGGASAFRWVRRTGLTNRTPASCAHAVTPRGVGRQRSESFRSRGVLVLGLARLHVVH